MQIRVAYSRDAQFDENLPSACTVSDCGQESADLPGCGTGTSSTISTEKSGPGLHTQAALPVDGMESAMVIELFLFTHD